MWVVVHAVPRAHHAATGGADDELLGIVELPEHLLNHVRVLWPAGGLRYESAVGYGAARRPR